MQTLHIIKMFLTEAICATCNVFLFVCAVSGYCAGVVKEVEVFLLITSFY